MSAPKTAKGLVLTVDTITKNTKAVEVRVFHDDDLNDLSYYEVYARRTAFSEDTTILPDAADRIGIISYPSSSFRFIPAYDYVWYFRVFSFSSIGERSADSVSSFVNVGDVNPILDFLITDLKVANSTPLVVDVAELLGADAEVVQVEGGDAGRGPLRGSNAVVEYFDAEAALSWRSDFIFQESPNIIKDLLGNFGYRICFRDKFLDSRTPSRNLFFSITDHKTTNFTLDTFSNITGFGGFYGGVTYPEFVRRNYDVTIEAHDDEGFSSAGGNFISGDSSVNYSNLQGFSILSLSNESVPSQTLSGENAYITIDNFIKFVNLPSDTLDISGYYIFASTGSFEPSDVKNKSEQEIRDKNIDILVINSNLNTIEVKPTLSGIKIADTAYVAVAYFDKFDKTVSDISKIHKGKIASDPTKDFFDAANLNISNVIRIKKNSNEIKESISEGFKVWIRINENGEWMGNGIKCVKKIDLDSSDAPESYKTYRGFVPYSCYSRDIGGFTDFYCGYKYDANKLRGGDRNDVKKGFKRYRVYFQDKFVQPDSNYAVIGLNASNAPYPKVDELFNSYSVETLNSIGLKEAFDAYKESTPPGEIYFGDGPAFYKHHPAGFGQGFGGLEKSQEYFDIHMGHLIDMSYLKEGYFAIVTNTDGNFLARAKDWTEKI